MKTRVLFVDDQPNILAGLRRMLRGCRDEWEMHFAESVDEALVLMAETPFDVVVADMRMPGKDGVALLGEVKKRHPATVRMILSGQADQESVMRAVTLAHQYLTKPCDADTLKKTVARACSLRNTLQDDSLVELVSRVSTLPSLPHVYKKLMNECKADEPSVKVIADLMSQDVGMTAKLMQMVNSSFFGMPRRVESPGQAAALLGINVLKPLALSAGVFSQFQTDAIRGFSADTLMEQSLVVSQLAQRIAESYCDDKEMAEDAALAGLLLDVGQLLLAANLPKQYCEVLSTARDQEKPLTDVELDVLGATHAEVGAYLLGLWGLADPIIEAVAYHHRPNHCMADGFSPLAAVHAANILVKEAAPTDNAGYCLNYDVAYLEQLGLTDQLPEWRDIAEEMLAVKV